MFEWQAVDDGELEIIPPYYTKTWKNWLSSIKWGFVIFDEFQYTHAWNS